MHFFKIVNTKKQTQNIKYLLQAHIIWLLRRQTRQWVSSVLFFQRPHIASVPESFQWLHMELRDFKVNPRAYEQADYLALIVFDPPNCFQGNFLSGVKE